MKFLDPNFHILEDLKILNRTNSLEYRSKNNKRSMVWRLINNTCNLSSTKIWVSTAADGSIMILNWIFFPVVVSRRQSYQQLNPSLSASSCLSNCLSSSISHFVQIVRGRTYLQQQIKWSQLLIVFHVYHRLTHSPTLASKPTRSLVLMVSSRGVE